MASTASVGTSATTSATKAHLFYSQFTHTIQQLEAQVDAAFSLRDLDPVLRQISVARSQLTDATNILPSHDRQLHERNLTGLTQRLTAKRRALQPARSGFTFKRASKPAVDPSSSTSQASAASSSAPAHPAPGAAGPSLSSASLPTPTVIGSTPKTTYLSIKSRCNRHVSYSSLSSLTSPACASSTQHDLHIRDLEGCIVDLRPPADGAVEAALDLGALQIRKLRRCIVLMGQVKGSVMVHDVEHCWLIIEQCRQFRMHTSSSTLVSLSTTGSIATIESCRRLRFAPVSARLRPSTGEKQRPVDGEGAVLKVQDFDALLTSSHLERETTDVARNWDLVEPAQLDRGVETLVQMLSALEQRRQEGEDGEAAAAAAAVEQAVEETLRGAQVV
ncbi:hypothetical protein ACQY0O_006713 [Thecaphora frezii]